jgi:hypothetical protein
VIALQDCESHLEMTAYAAVTVAMQFTASPICAEALGNTVPLWQGVAGRCTSNMMLHPKYSYEIWGVHSSVYENYCLLKCVVCYTVTNIPEKLALYILRV